MVLQNESRPLKGLHIWAWLTLACTFLLLCSGGIVTSKEAGMSVPDWPTTYGYNMFTFPLSKWVGGIFYEHSHRLIASGVGMMTLVLTAWILVAERRRWMKWLGVALFLAVCLQGLLGGLRVTLYKDELGIFHALLSQAFFCALGVAVVATSSRFLRGEWDFYLPVPALKNLVILSTVLVFLQLGLGATMRHEHAGLSIPDFPLAYGHWIPDTSPAAVAAINATRAAEGQVPTNALFIWIQMAHRAVACLVLLAVALVFREALATGAGHRVAKSWSAVWLAMVAAQCGLGAWTIWSGKSPHVATTHMALGALILLWGALFSFRLVRAADPQRFVIPDPQITTGLASRIA